MSNEFDDWEKFARGEQEAPQRFGFKFGAYEEEDDTPAPIQAGAGLDITDTDYKAKAKSLLKPDGNVFSMSDQDHHKRPQITAQERQRLKDAKKGFMGKARDFMDTTPLGEGGQNLLNRFMGKPKTPEPIVAEPEEEDDWEGEVEDEDYDYNEPESIHVGYRKPGTKEIRKKTIEEAREESFDLKMGGLANLLSRFGAEAEPEVKVEREIRTLNDKKPLQKMCQQIISHLEAESQESPLDPLNPLTLQVLLTANDPALILNFMFLALFAPTSENFMTTTDLVHLCNLSDQLELPFAHADIENHISQLFLFPERIFELADDLVSNPLEVSRESFQAYKPKLAEACLQIWATQAHLTPDLWIPHLADQWHQAWAQLQGEWQVLHKEQVHYQTFQQRGLSSPTVFAKVLKAEVDVLRSYARLQSMAQQLARIQQCLHLCQATAAIAEVQQVDYVGLSPISPDDTPAFGQLIQWLLPQHPAQARWQMWEAVTADGQTSELSPANQKRVIGHGKLGDIPALKLVYQYKAAKIQSTLQQLQQNPLYPSLN